MPVYDSLRRAFREDLCRFDVASAQRGGGEHRALERRALRLREARLQTLNARVDAGGARETRQVVGRDDARGQERIPPDP